MKKLLEISIISIMIMFALSMNVCAYETDVYKIDIPSDYVSMGYSGMDLFYKSENTGIMIITVESKGLKKDIGAMSNSDVKELVQDTFGYGDNILSQRKEKLGKAQAIKIRVQEDDTYMDIYMTVSDKHGVLTTFIAESEAELDSREFNEIKKSFKMKEGTTNVTIIKLIVIIIIVVVLLLKFRKKFLPDDYNYMQ